MKKINECFINEDTIKEERLNKKLKLIYDEILYIRQDLNLIQKQIYSEKLKKETEELQENIEYNKERIARLENESYWDVIEDKRKEFYN